MITKDRSNLITGAFVHFRRDAGVCRISLGYEVKAIGKQMVTYSVTAFGRTVDYRSNISGIALTCDTPEESEVLSATVRKLHADIKALQEAHEQEVDRLIKESK